jgi:outer membrane protein OmpU
MNIKKVGLTALAASLVSVSANAGELSMSGAASLGLGGYSGDNVDLGTSFTMGNQFTVTGSGELDNGITVSLSYELDNGASNTTSSPFDNHSLTLSSDDMGTLKFSGHGGSSASSSIDGTVAGDIWDGFDGALSTNASTGLAVSAAGAGNNSMFYTLPTVMDGVKLFASYNPQVAGTTEAEVGYGITYTGIEGLTASYATTDEETGTANTSGEQTAYKISYAYGPVTLGMSNSDYDVGSSGTDQEIDAYNIAYTVNDELSLSYGVEEISNSGSAVDPEFSAVVATYTSGGVTLTAKMEDAENIDGTTAAAADQSYWFLGAAFAF